MKLKLFTMALLGAFVFQLSANSQTNTDTNTASADQSAANADVVSNAPMTATDVTDVAAEPTNPPLAEVATSNETAVAVVSNAPAMAADNEVAADAETNAVPAPATIPLIQFQDVPLDTAIENLARQANINYLLDPKIPYGQPDQNGQVKPWPTLSIRWENITAQQALLALLENYSLQLVEDQKNKIARITTRDPSAPPPLVTRVIQLKYASTSNMMASVQAVLSDSRSRVLPDVRTSQLVVVATDSEQEAVDTLINELDKPTRQVLIETRLVEISSNPNTAKGINWSGTLAAQNFSFGNDALPGIPAQAAIPANPLLGTTAVPANQGIIGGVLGSPGILANTADGLNPSTMFLNADGVKAVLSFLNSSSDAQVVSTPRVVTLDNETATISVTRAFPVVNVTAATTGVSSGGSQVTYSNIGTTLEVTPRITANDYIWLKVIPDVSSFFGVDTKTIAGLTYESDIFDTRHIETQVMIPNANTLVMGGLVKDNPNSSYTKVPILGDIPVLGWAFRSENKTLDKDNLLIFITPTIVQDNDFQPTETDFLQTRPVYKKEPMNPNSPWDGAKPYDWSNPKNTDPDQALIDRTGN